MRKLIFALVMRSFIVSALIVGSAFLIGKFFGEFYAIWIIGLSAFVFISYAVSELSNKIYEYGDRISKLERTSVKIYGPIEDFSQDKNKDGSAAYNTSYEKRISGYKIQVHFDLNIPEIIRSEIKKLNNTDYNDILEKIYSVKDKNCTFGFERKTGLFMILVDIISNQRLTWSQNSKGMPCDEYYESIEIISKDLCLKAFGEEQPENIIAEIAHGDLVFGRCKYVGNNEDFGNFPLSGFIDFMKKNYIYEKNKISKFPNSDESIFTCEIDKILKFRGFDYFTDDEVDAPYSTGGKDRIVSHGDAEFFKNRYSEWHKFKSKFVTVSVKLQFSTIST